MKRKKHYYNTGQRNKTLACPMARIFAIYIILYIFQTIRPFINVFRVSEYLPNVIFLLISCKTTRKILDTATALR